MAGTTRERAAALAVLGLTWEATPAQVTAAYRRLARTTHPDRCADEDAGARFAALTDAYRRARVEAPGPEDAPAWSGPQRSAPPRSAPAWPAPAPTGPPPVRIGFAVGTSGLAEPDLIVGPVHVRPADPQDRPSPTTKEGWR